MNHRRFHRATACVVLLLALAAASPARAESRDAELEQMKAMIRALQSEVAELKKNQAEMKKEKSSPPEKSVGLLGKPSSEVLSAAVPTQTSNTPDRDTFLDEQWPAPRVNNAPIDPSLKGFIQIPGTSTIIKLGGSVRLDAIYDFGENGNPNQFIPSSFPLDGQPGNGGAGRSQIHAKGSRISLELRRPLGDSNNLRIYYENDFFGDSTSNSMTYRLRHLYGQAYNFLIGQTFSTFMNVDAFPDVIDYQGPNGMVNARSPQIRYTQPFMDNRFQFAVAVEQPNAQIGTDDDFYGSNSDPFNRMPDIAAHLRYEDKSWGHMQLSGLYRISSYENDTHRDDATGWGVSFSGVFKVTENDTLTFEATYGENIGRYLQDTGGLNLDAALDERSALQPIPIFAAAAGYTHKWGPKWKSTVSYGYVNADPELANGAFALDQSHYVSANLIYQPTPSFRMGLEYLYGLKQVVNGDEGDGSRLNFVIKYDLVK